MDQSQTAEFVRLLTDHQRQLYLYILTFLPHSADAEEVLQETNVVLWSKADEFTLGTSFAAWAQRVAYFKVLEIRQRLTRERLTFSGEMMEVFRAEIGADTSGQERRRALAICLEKLSERDRSLIDRRYAAGSTVEAMSHEINRPLGSIYRSLERIRLALLSCIQRELACQGESG